MARRGKAKNATVTNIVAMDLSDKELDFLVEKIQQKMNGDSSPSEDASDPEPDEQEAPEPKETLEGDPSPAEEAPVKEEPAEEDSKSEQETPEDQETLDEDSESEEQEEGGLDSYSDDSVKESVNESTDQISSDNVEEFANAARTNGRTVIERYGRLTSGTARPMLEQFVDQTILAVKEGVQDGSIKGISQAALDSLVRGNLVQVLSQEAVERAGAEGGQGIRWVCVKAQQSMDMLEELEKAGRDITGKQKLMALTAHASQGSEEPSSDVFGVQESDSLIKIVNTYGDQELDWDLMPVASAVRLANIMSLFGKGHVQDVMMRSPQAMSIACKLRMVSEIIPSEPKEPKQEEFKKSDEYDTAVADYGTQVAEYNGDDTKKGMEDNRSSQDTYKKQLHEVLDEGKFDPADRALLHTKVDEMDDGKVIDTTDVLSRYSGRVNGFTFDQGTGAMSIDISYSPEAQVLDQLFGDQKESDKFRTFLNGMGAAVTSTDRCTTEFSSGGKVVAKIIVNGADMNPVESATNSSVKGFLTKTARGHIQFARSLILPPPCKAKKRDLKKARAAMEEARGLFTDDEWSLMESLFDDHSEDPEVLSNRLRTFPLLKSETAYLDAITASTRRGSVVQTEEEDEDEDAFPRRENDWLPMEYDRNFIADEEARLEGLVHDVMVDAANSTGKGVKDKDLMSDTGGVGKHRKAPSKKPGRSDLKRKNVKRRLTKEQRKDLTHDTAEDPDLKKGRRGSRIKHADRPIVVNYNVPLVGKLSIKRTKGNEWGSVKIDDVIRKSIVSAMKLPDEYKSPKYKAHISVFDADEVLALPKKIEEEGQEFAYVLRNICTCNPEGWDGVDDLYMVTVDSDELEQLRASYGFSQRMNENKHDFHITLAIRKE